MPGTVKVEVTASFQDLPGAIVKALGPAVERRSRRIGEAMVASVEASVGQYKVRPANRRRYPGSTHITSGWDYKIVGDPVSLPILVNLIARGDSKYLERIRMLDQGTPAHIIRPRGDDHLLRFPVREGGRYVSARQVIHPGHDGDHFIHDALEAGRAAAGG